MAVQRRVGIFGELAGKRQSAIAAKQLAASDKRLFYIKYPINGVIRKATKLDPVDFTTQHLTTLASGHFDANNRLAFDNPAWGSAWLGAGEEKAVFLIVDGENRAFALELLVQGGYQDGRLVDGYYLANFQISQIAGRKRDPRCAFSLKFSGEAKAREFIFGETLAGPPLKHMSPSGNFGNSIINKLAWRWAKSIVYPYFCENQRRYRDAHEANVAIEFIPLHNPQRKSHFLFPILALGHDGRLHWYYYRLTCIDVRTVGA